MRVFHLAAECAPFVKVGGLGDVVGALPKALCEDGVRAAVVMPLYGGIGGALAERVGPLTTLREDDVRYGGRSYRYAVHRSDAGEVPLFLIDEPKHFGTSHVYVGPDGEPLPHADTRFVLFQLCVLDWLEFGETAPPDLLHLHDHHTGLLPALLHQHPAVRRLRGLPALFTVHSADHQGKAPWSVWERLGAWAESSGSLLVEDQLNMMKAALFWANHVTTVSPGYVKELMHDNETAKGLAETFRSIASRFTGILNGIDTAVWNPSTDRHLAETFSAEHPRARSKVKEALCEDLGLHPDRPLLAFVGRLVPEKGVDILPETIERVVRKTEASVAVLGRGRPEHEAHLRGLTSLLRVDGLLEGRLSVTLAFDEALAHQLYGGADLFLMPSKTEPCGLGQLYAMRYGSVPLVHAVGGLRDTVTPWPEQRATGFRFEGHHPEPFFKAVDEALEVFNEQPEAWRAMQRRGMTTDWGWGVSARQYAQLYRRLVPQAATPPATLSA